jgi:hypothetical protein
MTRLSSVEDKIRQLQPGILIALSRKKISSTATSVLQAMILISTLFLLSAKI